MEFDDDADAEAGASAKLETELSQGRGSWEGSYIILADIDNLRRSNKLSAGVEARVPPAEHHYPCPKRTSMWCSWCTSSEGSAFR